MEIGTGIARRPLASGPPGRLDPAEEVARVATAARARLLRIHSRRLGHHDLEDAYSQATLEVIARARRSPFEDSRHVLNAIEQKFSSRINDRRRAISGRSPIEAAMANAVSVDASPSVAGELRDGSAEPVGRLSRRLELSRVREVANELTDDQRLVIACQISLGMDCAAFCGRFGWSPEKYRKVAQRGRGRLRALVDEYQSGERCRRLEADIVAWASQTASAEQAERVTLHLQNCQACAAFVRGLDAATRSVAALLPFPAAGQLGLVTGVLGKIGHGMASLMRRAVPGSARGAHAAASGGSSLGGLGALKAAAVAVVCAGGAVGGYAAGQTPSTRVGHGHRAVARVVGPDSAMPVLVTTPAPGRQAQLVGRRHASRLAPVITLARHAVVPEPRRVSSGPNGSMASREFSFER